RLKRACNQISHLETPNREVGLENPYVIYDYCGGSHEADERKQSNLARQKSHTKGIRDMLEQHRKELHEQFFQIFSTTKKYETPKPEAPTFVITTRSGVNTQDPPFLAPPQPTSENLTGGIKKERPEGKESSIIEEPAPQPSIFYQPFKSSNLPFLSRLKKQKKDDEDERLF
nr:hypothetical protein [Tanacetum cinerariifolium]